MTKIVFASGNKGKIAELNYLLEPHNIECISQESLGVEPAIEDGKTFIENAILKARHVATYTNLPVLADDSGIIIDKLDGEPGIYSARYAGVECDGKKNIAKVIDNLAKKNIDTSPARFCCALAFFQTGKNDQMPAIFTGIWEGSVISEPRGHAGFGYDPIFLDPKSNKTAAELGGFAKQAYSHRAKALQKFIDYFLAA
jgi:XTP/dITP diphosphohydrolase